RAYTPSRSDGRTRSRALRVPEVKRIFFGPDFEVPAWLPGALTLLLLLPGITRSFWDRDEAQYAAIARDMEEAGHFFNPELFGRPYAEKPPLAIALTAVSFLWLGESEIACSLTPDLMCTRASVLSVIHAT